MLIFLHGSDTYRSRQKLNEIIGRYKDVHKSGLNLKYLDGSKLKFQDFKSDSNQATMFKEKKLIVLCDAFSNSDFKEKFLKKKKEFLDSEDIIVLYEKSKVPKKGSLFTFLKKNATCQEFEALTGQNLKRWVKKEFGKLGAEIDSMTMDKLIVFVGDDLWQMANEIRKLASFKDGQRIESGDIDLLIKPKIEPEIFKTIDAIASKDKKRALKLLKGHLEKGDNVFRLFSMINFQFRNLIVIKDLVERNLPPLKFSNLHPFVVRKSTGLLKRFNSLELKKIYQNIFKIDLDIKTGRVEPETAFDLLITSL